MVAKGNRKVGECAYCGDLRPLTRDHIPSVKLFSKPRPDNLITVPSCDACNHAASLDDEYFRLAVTAGIDPGKFPNEFSLSISAIQKLGTPKKLGLGKAMLQNFSRKSAYTPGGLYLGEAGVLKVNGVRVLRVVERIVRGLFFHHLGRRLPKSSTKFLCSDWFKQDLHDEALLVQVQTVLSFLGEEEAKVIGAGVFSYSYRLLEDEPEGSIWWLSFYDHRRFLFLTQPISHSHEHLL